MLVSGKEVKMIRHKHADMIHAFAEGFTIQKLDVFCCDTTFRRWVDITTAPSWFEDVEYRVKPEKPAGFTEPEEKRTEGM